MKKTLRRLGETKVGESTLEIGLTVVFGRNEEEWKGRIADIWNLRNGKAFYIIENAVSDSGKVQTFTIRDNEVIKIITESNTPGKAGGLPIAFRD
jgi:hypothetical protein